MSGIERLLRSFDHGVYRYAADYDLHLDLGKQSSIKLDSSVIFTGTLLYAAPHHLSHCHAGDTELIQSLLQCIEACQLGDDRDLVHSRIVICTSFGRDGDLLYDLHRCILLCFGSVLISTLSEVRVLVHIHHGTCHILNGKSRISTGKTMLSDIQALYLLLCRSTESESLVYDKESDIDRHCCPYYGTEHSYELYAQELEASAVEETQQLVALCIRERICGCCVGSEKSHCQCSPHSVDQMYRAGTHRIVHSCHIVKEPYSEYHEKTCHTADDHGAGHIHHITGCRDGHESCQRCVQAHGNIGLSVFDPCEYHTYHRSH